MPKRIGFVKLQGAKATGELLSIIIIIMCCTTITNICCQHLFPWLGLSLYMSDIPVSMLVVMLECKASDLLNDVHEVRSIREGLVGGLGNLLNVMP